MEKRLNVKLLVRLAVILLVLGVAVHGVHSLQVKAQARSYRQQGEAAAKEGDFARCVHYLGRYLKLRPGDLKAQTEYALALARIASTSDSRWQAYNELEKVLRQGRESVEVRQALGQL